MSNATVQVEVLAAVADFKAQMASAAVAMNQAVRKMGGDLGEFGGAAKKTSDHVGGLTEMLKHHRREMRAEAGMTKVLARDMAAMGIDAHGAGGAVAHLLGAFTIGGGFGVALAGVKLVAEWFRHLGAEEEAAAEAAKKWGEEVKKGAAEAAAELDKARDKFFRVTPVQATLRKQAGINSEIAKTQAYVSALEEDAAKLAAGQFYDDLGIRIDPNTVAKLEAARNALADLRRTSDSLGDTARFGVADSFREEGDKRREAARKAAAAAREEELKGQEDEKARQRKKVEEYLAGEERYGQESARLRAHWARVGISEEMKLTLDYNDATAKLREDDVAARAAVWSGYQRQLGELRAKEQADRERDRVSAEKWTADIERTFSHAMTAMVMNARSFGDIVAGVFESLAASIIAEISRIAAKWLALTALKGLGDLATGGAVTSAGGLDAIDRLANGGLMPGFAGGGNFSGASPFIVGESGPELVVPRGAAGTVIPNGAISGGGETHVHFHGALIDRSVVEDFGRRYGRDLAKGMRGQ